MKWLELGTYSFERDNKLEVVLHEGYEKALVKLGLFSHCLLFLLLEDRIDVKVAKIAEVDDKQGIVILEWIHSHGGRLKGQLIDIKPYFPNEEVILDAKEPNHHILVKYENSAVGEYMVQGHSSYIQMDGDSAGNADNEISIYNQINEGDYLRILWWFHRFDKDNFRKNRMCNPPYNNAPRSGIFATRSPVRPNPIASTVVKVTGVDMANERIEINGFDGFSGSKILQIMFYKPEEEKVEEVVLPPWVSHWTKYKDFKEPKKITESSLDINPVAVDEQSFEEPDILNTVEDDEYFHDQIHIRNAYIHNLKNISVTIPKNQITLITGVSGSGKSSLAFDTLYAESQKQFMDLVLSNQMDSDALVDSHVEKISGLQPAIAIKQKNLGANPRSTVGSSTRIAELVKLLFTSIGVRLCPNCHEEVNESNVCEACGTILFDRTPQLFSYNHPDYMCPVCKGLGEEMQIDENLIIEHQGQSLLDKASPFYGDLRKHRKKPNANWMRGEVLALADDLKVDLDVPYKDLPENFKQQFLYGSNGREVSLSYENSKGRSGIITRPVEGAVNVIQRLARDTKSKTGLDNMKRYMSKNTCSRCNGERLLEEGRLVHIEGTRYPEVMKMSIDELRRWCHKAYKAMAVIDRKKSIRILQKINSRLQRIEHVGLSYISLDRSIPSLSGGESQRLKLATQFGTGLSDILYIMDEPSKGLHPKDYHFLMEAIEDLKDHGNTVVLVEHKDCFRQIADMHIAMGPKAGRYGGEIVGVYPKEQMEIKPNVDEILIENVSDNDKAIGYIHMKDATTNNLKKVSAKIPIGMMTAVIGVSGSGKSSLISKTLLPYIESHLGRSVEEKGRCNEVIGIEGINDVSYVNQKPIGSNSRSNPATYTGVFDSIRKCYSKLEGSKERGFGKEHFSFNSKKGQCPDCSGLGEIAVNMHYMDDLYVPCNTCHGKRYNQDVLEIKRKGLTIGDILAMEISELLSLFEDVKEIYDQMLMLEKVGLGYLKLGQSASTLSGGEAQRIKLAKELYKKSCRGVLYILDEPTTGLHATDTEKIIKVLKELNEKGATIVIIEHNMLLINECEYIIELGPGGGHRGGSIVREGYLSRTDL